MPAQHDFNLSAFQNIILPALQNVKELKSEATEANESFPFDIPGPQFRLKTRNDCCYL